MNKSLSRLLIVVLGIACMPLVAKRSQAELEAEADRKRKETRQRLLDAQPHIAAAKEARDNRYARQQELEIKGQLDREVKEQQERVIKEQEERDAKERKIKENEALNERYARQLAQEKAQKERKIKEKEALMRQVVKAAPVIEAAVIIASSDQDDSTNVSKETTIVKEGSSIFEKMEDSGKQPSEGNATNSDEDTPKVKVVPKERNNGPRSGVTPLDLVFGLPLFCHYAIDKYLAQYASIGLVQRYLSQTDAVRMGIQAGVIGSVLAGTGYLGYILYKKYLKKQPVQVTKEVV